MSEATLHTEDESGDGDVRENTCWRELNSGQVGGEQMAKGLDTLDK